MTRQYIGARYVPKFYQNSVDGSAAWESNVVYEPLTYVTLTNGHMYISKKQVPATVGTPASNVEYWLDVGSYNGFIDDLQNQIDTINNTTIPAVESEISALANKNLDVAINIANNDYEENDIIHVMGYYDVGDGGECDYVVTNTSNAFTITTQNGLYAMPFTNRPTPEIFGAHCDGVNDDTPFIDKAIAYVLFFNPVTRPSGIAYERDMGGGCVYFNGKDYYAQTKLTSKLACIKLQGASNRSTKIHCTNGFVKVDYSDVTSADYPFTIPWHFTVNDILFINLGGVSVFKIDKPYGVRFNRCAFATDSNSHDKGNAIELSTIVNVIINDCEFAGYNYGILVSLYNGTYPSGSIINQNTTLKVTNCTFYSCTYGVGTANNAALSLEIIFENCILEAIDSYGVYVNTDISIRSSQLIFHDCYFENLPIAISVRNAGIIFDESNQLARAVGENRCKIEYFESRVSQPSTSTVKNEIYLHKDDDISISSNNLLHMVDYIPTVLTTPKRYINSHEKIMWREVTAAFLFNFIDANVHPNVVCEIIGNDTYAVYKATLTTSTETNTEVIGDSNVTNRADGALVASADAKFIVKWM